jgi:hypothetical protein
MKYGTRRAAELPVADRQGQLLLDRPIHLAAHQQKAGRGIQNLKESPLLPKHNLPRPRQDMTCQCPLPLLRINSRHHRQLMPPQPLDVLNREPDIRVNPHRLLRPIGQRIRCHLTPSLIDGRIPADAADLVAFALECA